MNINIKARLKNKAFVVSLVALAVSFVYKMLSLFQVVAPVGESEVIEAAGILINILGIIGVLTDPTTEGVSDSQRALTYYTNEDIRIKEEISCE